MNKNRLPAYDDAQKKYGYGGITLRREGDYAVVEIEVPDQSEDGFRQVEVIREFVDGNFCHSVTSLGIADVIEGREGVTLDKV